MIFRPRRYRLSATSYRHARTDAMELWNGYAPEMTAWGKSSILASHRRQAGNAAGTDQDHAGLTAAGPAVAGRRDIRISFMVYVKLNTRIG